MNEMCEIIGFIFNSQVAHMAYYFCIYSKQQNKFKRLFFRHNGKYFPLAKLKVPLTSNSGIHRLNA